MSKESFDVGSGVGVPDFDGTVLRSRVEVRGADAEGEAGNGGTVLRKGVEQLILGGSFG